MNNLPRLSPAAGNGLGGFPRSSATISQRGEISFTLPGTYIWTVPAGVTSVCVVAVGGGGSPYINTGADLFQAGAGGALAWANDIPVKPGDQHTIVVGKGGATIDVSGNYTAGTASTALGVSAGGGTVGTGGSRTFTGLALLASKTGGGNGGATTSSSSAGGYSGGGGAGGYSGNGGAGGTGGINPTAGSGGGGGGGAAGLSAGSGGGVGIFGEGSSGSAGVNGTTQAASGRGGSGGQIGCWGNGSAYSGVTSAAFGNYGGGLAGWSSGDLFNAASGAVRILWGKGRAFPSTDVGPS